jgi:hypothetical protein
MHLKHLGHHVVRDHPVAGYDTLLDEYPGHPLTTQPVPAPKLVRRDTGHVLLHERVLQLLVDEPLTSPNDRLVCEDHRQPDKPVKNSGDVPSV